MTIQKKLFEIALLGILAVFSLLLDGSQANERAPLIFVGNDSYPPISYQEGGEAKGLAIDIVRALEKQMGHPIEIKLMEWKQAQELVAQGKADALCQLSVTDARKQIYDFSDQVHDLRFSIFVRTGKIGISNLADIRGLRVGVAPGSIPHRLVETDPQIRMTLIADDIQGFQMLRDGKLDAVVVDYWVGTYILAEHGITDIQASGEPVARLASAIAVKKDNTKLLNAINEGIRTLQADGSLARINEKWMPKEVIYQTREQVTRKTYFATTTLLILLLTAAAFWIITMRREMTRRHRIEELLRQKEEEQRSNNRLLRSIMDNTFQLQGLLSPDGKVIDANATALKMINASKESIVGRYFWETPWWNHDPSLVEKIRQGVADAAAGAFVRFETIHIDWTGKPYYLDFSLKPVLDEKGKAAFLISEGRDITEQKIDQMKYRTLFESASDAILIMKDDVFIDCNQKTIEMFLCAKEQIIGQQPYMFSPPTQPDGKCSKEKAAEKIDLSLTREPQTFEWQHKKYNGDLFDAEVSLACVKIGSEKYLQAIVRDISLRKQTEHELKKKEEQQALLLRSLPMAFYIAQPFGTYDGTWVSEQIEAISGFNPDQFIAETDLWVNRLHPDDREYVLKEFDNITQADSISVEYRWKVADGTYRWINDEGILIRDDQGNPKEIVGVWLDITERIQEQEALLFTQHAVDFSSSPILWYQDRKIIYANKATCQLTGYSREELFALPPGSFHPQGSTEYWEKYFSILQQDKSLRIEFDFKKKDGTIFPVMLTTTYLERQGKNYVFVVMTDLTERKKLESELRQAQKMEAIGTLAGGIAHDFNNILSAIFGYNELAQMDRDMPEKLQRDLDEIHKAGNRAKDLVKQILTFSRRTEQEKKPLQVSLILKEALKMLRSSIPTTIEIKQDIQSESTILADPTQIHQVIMNLCTNAYHAMRDTGGTMIVALKEVSITAVEPSILPGPPAGKYARLEVSDTGCGIGKDLLGKIFEPYFTTKGVGEGTGLGLAVVHGIVESHKGFIHVYSEPGQGTTFHVYFPLIKAAVDELTKEEEICLLGKERLMFVDDEEPLRQIAEEILAKYGYSVAVYSNGVQALQEFEKAPDRFDLIITDMAMPYMSGSELAQKILGIRQDMPIILCSGFSELLSKEKNQALGVRAYIQKPIVMTNLIRTIRKIVSQKKTF